VRSNKYGRNVSLRDVVADIITEALPYVTDDEKVASETFTSSNGFDRMLDDILVEVDKQIKYNIDKFKEDVTK